MLTVGILTILASPGCLVYERITETRTCLDQGTRRDGETCVCDDECSSSTCFLEAFTGLPQGMCFRECKTSEDCEGSTVCDFGWCAPPCNDNADCESSRVCSKTGEADACFPLCSSGPDCESGICNPYSGRCSQPGDPEPFGFGTGEDCREDNECKSQFCSKGGCTSFCSVERQGCPDGGICVRTGSGDLGLCFPTCETNGDCRPYAWSNCARTSAGNGYCAF